MLVFWLPDKYMYMYIHLYVMEELDGTRFLQ